MDQEILDPGEETMQRFWLQSLWKVYMPVGRIVRVDMPLTGMTIYPENALTSFDKGKVE